VYWWSTRPGVSSLPLCQIFVATVVPPGGYVKNGDTFAKKSFWGASSAGTSARWVLPWGGRSSRIAPLVSGEGLRGRGKSVDNSEAPQKGLTDFKASLFLSNPLLSCGYVFDRQHCRVFRSQFFRTRKCKESVVWLGFCVLRRMPHARNLERI